MRALRTSTGTVLLALAMLAWPSAQDQSRESWQRVDDVIEALGVGAGSHVADIGAGDGFFTLRLARAVGATGRVYAVDVAPAQLERLRARVTAAALGNVDIIQGAQDDPHLPDDRLDAALVVNAYHEFEQPAAMLAHIDEALRPTGRLVLVEPIARSVRGRSRREQARTHNLDAEHAEADLRAAGFRIRRLEDPFTTRPGGRDDEWLVVATPPDAEGGAPAETTAPAIPFPDVARVERAELQRLLDAAGVTVVDVRSPGEFRTGHIPGAVLVPLDAIIRRAPELRAAGRPIVTYCS